MKYYWCNYWWCCVLFIWLCWFLMLNRLKHFMTWKLTMFSQNIFIVQIALGNKPFGQIYNFFMICKKIQVWGSWQENQSFLSLIFKGFISWYLNPNYFLNFCIRWHITIYLKWQKFQACHSWQETWAFSIQIWKSYKDPSTQMCNQILQNLREYNNLFQTIWIWDQ